MGRRVVFRFDAGPKVGGGHAMRCLSLADAMVSYGWDCRFAVDPETMQYVQHLVEHEPSRAIFPKGCNIEPSDVVTVFNGEAIDLLVVDHYGLDFDFEQACRVNVKRILAIDDLADRRHDSDFLLDQTLGRKASDYEDLLPSTCSLMLGPKYALLRPQFAALREQALRERWSKEQINKILISFGMSDARGLALKALSALENIDFDGYIDVVIGSSMPSFSAIRAKADVMGERVRVLCNVENMAMLMAEADLTIGGSGTTAWERCALGLPSIVILVAENQSAVSKALKEAGAIWLLDGEAENPSILGGKILKILNDVEDCRRKSKAASMLCDANGCSRVVEMIDG